MRTPRHRALRTLRRTRRVGAAIAALTMVVTCTFAASAQANTPISGQDDTLTLAPTAYSIPLGDLLANDQPGAGRITSWTAGRYIGASPETIYTWTTIAVPRFVGTDAFTYTVTDFATGESYTSTVTVIRPAPAPALAPGDYPDPGQTSVTVMGWGGGGSTDAACPYSASGTGGAGAGGSYSPCAVWVQWKDDRGNVLAPAGNAPNPHTLVDIVDYTPDGEYFQLIGGTYWRYNHYGSVDEVPAGITPDQAVSNGEFTVGDTYETTGVHGSSPEIGTRVVVGGRTYRLIRTEGDPASGSFDGQMGCTTTTNQGGGQTTTCVGDNTHVWVTYVYQALFTVTTNFVDEQGNPIAEPVVTDLIPDGSAYETEVPDTIADGETTYRLLRTQGDPTSGALDADKTVTAVYEAVSTSATFIKEAFYVTDVERGDVSNPIPADDPALSGRRLGDVVWRYTVTNTGDEAIENVVVYDESTLGAVEVSRCTQNGQACTEATPAVLQPGQSGWWWSLPPEDVAPAARINRT